MANTTQSLKAYFSHSYKPQDREVNLAFWEIFSKEGFFFTVDPVISAPKKERGFVIPHVERLMRFADCFIAVVTHRINKNPDGSTEIKHSDYIAFECFLAELADKPRLIFVEDDLELSLFGSNDYVSPFSRNILRTEVNQYSERVHKFAEQVRTYKSYKAKTPNIRTRKAGILLKDLNGYPPEILSAIQLCLKGGNFTTEIISPRLDHGLKEFTREISDFELIVIDVQDTATPLDAMAVIQAKSIPCIRLARFAPGASVEELKSHKKGLLKDYLIKNLRPLSLLKDYILDDDAVLAWENSAGLIDELNDYLERFKEERDAFDTYEKGKKYFISAGRREHKVFIGNPDSLNPLALELAKEFENLNIQYFQYKSKRSLPMGEDWKENLEEELQEGNIFVFLVNNDFHKSQHCQWEMEVAIGRYKYDGVTILPFLCTKTRFPTAIQDHLINGKDISIYSKDKEKIKVITEEVEKELLKPNPKKEKTVMPENQPEEAKKISVFLNHASEDKPLVRDLYQSLKKIPWLDPWLDEEKLLPGQDWDYEIEKAIKNADAVIICISETSSTKIGVVQAEIRKAQEMQERRPQGYIYMIPVLLGKCKVPDNLREYHWVDITVKENIDKIVKSLETIKSFKR